MKFALDRLTFKIKQRGPQERMNEKRYRKATKKAKRVSSLRSTESSTNEKQISICAALE